MTDDELRERRLDKEAIVRWHNEWATERKRADLLEQRLRASVVIVPATCNHARLAYMNTTGGAICMDCNHFYTADQLRLEGK